MADRATRDSISLKPRIRSELKLRVHELKTLELLSKETEGRNEELKQESIAIALENRTDNDRRGKLHAELADRVSMETREFSTKVFATFDSDERRTRAKQLLFRYFVANKRFDLAARVGGFSLTEKDIATLKKDAAVFNRREWEEQQAAKWAQSAKILSAVLDEQDLRRATGKRIEPRALFGGKMFEAGIRDSTVPSKKSKTPKNPRR